MRSAGAVQGVSMLAMFPLTFASNVFVDPSTMPQQASQAVVQFKQAGATTIILAADFLMTTNLTLQARQQAILVRLALGCVDEQRSHPAVQVFEAEPGRGETLEGAVVDIEGESAQAAPNRLEFPMPQVGLFRRRMAHRVELAAGHLAYR